MAIVKTNSTVLRKSAALATGCILALSAGVSLAQPAPDPTPAEPAPAAPPAGDDGELAPAPLPAPPDTANDELADALRASPNGLTSNDVGKRAQTTSFAVKARRAELRSAAAKVDQAFVSYFPRLTLTAQYTRVSDLDNDLGGGGGGLLAAANEGPVTTGPCPNNPAATCVIDAGGLPVSAQALSFNFPVILNQYLLSANLTVPISDYALRLTQAYAAADDAVEAERYDLHAAEAKAAADAKLFFYDWLRAKGQTVVARQAVQQAKAHVDDATVAFEAGLIARADVLRLEAQVARAQGVEAQASAFETVAEQQVRTSIHAEDSEQLKSGVDVFSTPASADLPPLPQLFDEATSKRLELKSLRRTESSLEGVESVTKAGYLPRLEAFGNLIYANPNPRVIPQEQKWDLTWDVGLRLSWTVNETFSTAAAVTDAEAQTATVAEQRRNLEDAIRVEVAAAYAEVGRAKPTIEAAERELEAAEESLRTRRKLFQFGRATSVDLVDAETEVTRARLNRLNAHIDLLVALVRLDHALGRDVQHIH